MGPPHFRGTVRPVSFHPGLNEEGGAEVVVGQGRLPAAAWALRITPGAVFGSRRFRYIFERNVMVYRRGWILLVSGFFEPFFYLLSIGVGLNALVGPLDINGVVVPYTAFVAPGLLASSAMNGAMFDSTFNIFFKLKIAKTYEAVLSTPLGVGDVALGELSWALLRAGLYSGAFLVVMAALGYVFSPWVILCWPGALLISYAFARRGHGRDHLHAELAGLRSGLTGHHPPLSLFGHVLPDHRLPGLASGGGPLYPLVPGGGYCSAASTSGSSAGPCSATPYIWLSWAP